MADAPEHSPIVRDPAPTGPVLGLPGAESAETYRPLSLLAVAGFSLAVLYAVAVTLGGLAVFATRHPTAAKVLLVLAPLVGVVTAVLRREPGRIGVFAGAALALAATVLGLGSMVAYSGSNPWLLHDIMWVVLVAALLICWMARVRIQASEDTLSGAALAGWGLVVGLFFGVIYSAYLASSVLAVSSQARQASEHFLQRLEENDLAGAFLLTLKPSARPPAQSDPREILEVQYNVPGQSEQGAFTKFCQSDLARLLQIGGKETTLKLERSHSGFDKGEYRVTMRYALSVPPGEFEAVVTAVGLEAVDGRGPRQWYIDTNFTAVVDRKKQTAAGKEMDAANRVASEFADRWTTKLRLGARGDQLALDAAYLDTVAPEQREAQKVARLLFSPVLAGAAGLSPQALALGTPAGRAYHQGRAAFTRAGPLDHKEFWASKKSEDGQTLYQAMLAEVGKIFAGTLEVVPTMERDRIRYLLSTTRDGRTLLGVPYRVLLPTPDGKPNFRLEAEVVVEAPLASGPPSPEALRIHSLRLLRGQSAPAGPPGRQRR